VLLIYTLAVILLHTLFQFFQSYYTSWLGQHVIFDIRKELFAKMLGFKTKYFDNTPVGSLVTRVTSDIQNISDIFSDGILLIVSDIIQLIVALIFMFWMNPGLALVTLIPIPLLLWATNIFKNSIKVAFQEVRGEVARINTFIQEHVTGMAVIQMFNREDVEMKKFKEVNHAHMSGWIKTIWANSIFFPLVEVLSACSLSLIIWYGVKEVVDNDNLNVPIEAFILYTYMIYRPIRQLADRFNTLQMGMVASDRVFKVLDSDEHVADEGKVEKMDVQGNIEFKNVHFSYVADHPVLKGISFKATKGQSIALVGATGAGKTSIINVLSRFYEIESGEVLIDGVNIKDIQLDLLRKNVAVVLQDVFLFDDSIYGNISLGNPAITRQQVEDAAKLIGVDEFIQRLPGGYDYSVRERGAMLSVGQRQLLAFLRAYVYNPKILVLDEATSSIDTESEILIQKAIQKLTEGRTSIIIAHRLSTIQSCDKIIVLDKGEIVESGSHHELLGQSGYYKRLYDYQFADINLSKNQTN
ncbi:MAG: ABC transporter ATP-binding protein, partial [Bacteroidetes bacterium]|nr:ABC transporter ATP-binding protein [Bacteroidota bacterium]